MTSVNTYHTYDTLAAFPYVTCNLNFVKICREKPVLSSHVRLLDVVCISITIVLEHRKYTHELVVKSMPVQNVECQSESRVNILENKFANLLIKP